MFITTHPGARLFDSVDSPAPNPIDPVLTVQPDNCYIIFSLKNTCKYYFMNYHNIIHFLLVRRIKQTLKQNLSSCYYIMKTYYLTNLGRYKYSNRNPNNKGYFNRGSG